MPESTPNPIDQQVSVIAHKLRTPLTVITSTVGNLLDGAFGQLTEEQRRWLKKLETHNANLETLLNDILNILRQPSAPAASVRSRLNSDSRSTTESTAKMPEPSATTLVWGNQTPPTILIVDDEPDVRDVIQEGMTMKGFSAITASSGDDAFAVALERRPDLILMDVLLGHENGIEVCGRIKGALPYFVPVILVTGQDDLRQKIAGSQHDADDLLTKPFQMEELFTRVNSMLRMKQLTDEVARLKNRAAS